MAFASNFLKKPGSVDKTDIKLLKSERNFNFKKKRHRNSQRISSGISAENLRQNLIVWIKHIYNHSYL